MVQFTTISPTHVPGKKPQTWEQFRNGNYVAIGWLDDCDLTHKSTVEVTSLIEQKAYENERAAIQSFERFLSLKPGDLVAVNNTNHGLFGVGEIISGYRYEKRKHDSGDGTEFYAHYMDVKWIKTSYMPRILIVREGETPWQPYGTVGKVYSEVPPYIARLLDGELPAPDPLPPPQRPAFLETVIEDITLLRSEGSHMERAHESLVEGFLVALGYRKHKDIKYRHGRVDITIKANELATLLIEVKANWDLSLHNATAAVRQAYNYAHEQGIRHVAVTNGDTYILFDRLKGLSWESNLLGEFQLTSLHVDDLLLIDRMKRERLGSPDLTEALRFMSESFRCDGTTGTSA